MKLRSKDFNNFVGLANFVNENKISREQIQTIITSGSRVELYWWEWWKLFSVIWVKIIHWWE